jgi:hypothetical protein
MRKIRWLDGCIQNLEQDFLQIEASLGDVSQKRNRQPFGLVSIAVVCVIDQLQTLQRGL